MTIRANAVKPTYRPIKNTELKVVALIYKELLGKPGVLVLFTAENGTIDATWVTNFDGAITAVGNIVPSSTIRSTNRDITKGIVDASKKSVKYGKKLTMFLKKAFLPAQPGLYNSFPVLAANNKMRDGDTEGFLYEVNTIIEQIQVPANQAALVAKGWPTSNLTDYQTLYSTVETLNTQQEVAKQLIPENTDDATTIRNTCYSFINELVETKDLVYDEDKQKKHNWAVRTILNQIRGGGGAGGVTVELTVNMGEVKDVDMSGVSDHPGSLVTTIVEDNAASITAAPTPGPTVGPTQWNPGIGTVGKTQVEWKTLIGFGGSNTFVKVVGLGPGVSKVKLVFAS